MKKKHRLNAFDMNCVGRLSTSLWTHQRDRAHTYKNLDYCLKPAKLLERGKFACPGGLRRLHIAMLGVSDSIAL